MLLYLFFSLKICESVMLRIIVIRNKPNTDDFPTPEKKKLAFTSL